MEAQKQNFAEKANEKPKGNTTKEKIDNTLTEEVVIGICSPIGSLRRELINEIKQQLKSDYGYDVEEIKLSDAIDEKFDERAGETVPFSRMMNKIKGTSVQNS
jgi:hypothetical protein